MAELNDLERAFKALTDKQAHHDEKWAYYDGNTPMVYSTKKLRELFGNIDANWSENWCAVVVDSAFERINLARFQAEDDATTRLINELWEATEMNLDSDDTHLASLVCGEGFVIVGEGEGGIEAYYNDPRNVWIRYDSARPKVKQYAAKWWVGDDEHRYMTLYYTDRFEDYKSTAKAKNQKSGGPRDWESLGSTAHTYGEIPVFHFKRERRAIKSEMLNAMRIQDAVNKLFADMMIASEFGTIRQRWAVTNAENAGATLSMGNAVTLFPAGDKDSEPTQVGEFDSADTEKAMNAMRQLVGDLATITRTPHNYFEKQGGTPSGEALIAMEAPLVKKCKNYIERYTAEWRRVAAFMLKLSGRAVDPSTITPIFDSPETVQPRTRAEIRQISTNAGIPLDTVLRREEGWSDDEIAAMDKDRQADSVRRTEERAAVLGSAGAFFDRGNTE